MTIKKKTILIIESEPISALGIKETLLNLGYTVTEIANSLEKAIEFTKINTPDIIIIENDGVDGVTISKELRKLISTPIIFISNSLNDSLLPKIKESGINAFLSKPINEKELLFAIEAAILKHNSELQVLESQIKFKSVVEHSPLGMMFFSLFSNESLVLTGYNSSAERILELSLEKFIGLEFLDVFPKLKETDLLNIFTDIASNGEQYHVDDLVYQDDTISGCFEIYAFQTSKDNMSLMFSEISDRKILDIKLKEALDRAEESSQLKSNLLGNLSHEFRTPLFGILGFANILYDMLVSNEQKQMLEKIMQSTKRLTNTLNSVLYFSELESNRIPLNIKAIKLNNIVQNISLRYKSLAKERLLDFEFVPYQYDIEINSDEKLITFVVDALLENAIKFTNEGKVEVSIDFEKLDGSFDEGNCIINISDSGIGIPENKLDLIFKEFRQSSEGLSRSYEGLGLGLTVAARMVQMFNGAIRVKSAYNVGSTFSVVLPSKVVYKSSPPFHSSSEFSKISDVLIVEDNQIHSELTKRYLMNEYKVSSSSSAIHALEMVQQEKYDVILLDINLGEGLNGIDLLKRIKSIEKYKYTPIVAVTGYAMLAERNRLLSEGFNYYLQKPFEKIDLLELFSKIKEDLILKVNEI